MANSNSARVIKLTVMVNGQRQVLKTLEDYQTHMKRLAVHMNDLDQQIKNAGNNPALLKRLQAERAALAGEIKDMKDYVKALKQAQTDINSIAAKVKSKQSLADVKSDNRNAKQVASRLDPGNKQQAKDLEKINKIIGEQNYKIREQEKAMKAVVMPAKELGNVLGNLKSAPLDQLKNAEAELVRQLSQATRGTEEFARTNSRLQSVRQQIQATGESMKGVAMSTTQLNNTMRSLSTAPMQKLKTAEEQLKRAIADGNLTEKQREKTLKNLSSVQREITKREQETAAATKKGAQAAKDAAIGYKDYQTVLGNQKATMEQLKRAAQELKEKMEKTAPNSRAYHNYAQALQQVNERIKQGTEQHTKHANAISQAMSRLKTYVMIYMGFNKLLDVIRSFKQQVLGLSDSIADIQKVTKMSEEAVDNLSDAINGISTRSSIEQLHKLGYQAGLMGLSAKKDVLGFVNAANQMNWALKELGEDGAVQLMKVANMTGDIKKLGVEQALTKIGSAINEITANSAASAGPVTEIVSRLGAIGSQAGYASHELVGIASTMNALGLKSEASATAVQKIMMALQTNISPIAEKIGVSADTIRSQGSAMEQLLFVLKTLRDQTNGSANAFEVLKPIFKDMGRDGTRLASTLTTLVKNYDTLTYHLNMTSEAYDEGVSMLNEYNVKNETAAAQIERIGNAIAKVFTNSTVTRGLQTVLKPITFLFEKTRLVAGAMEAMVTAAVVGLGYKVVKSLGALSAAMKKSNADTEAAIIAKRTEIAVQNELNAAKARGVTITREAALALVEENGAVNKNITAKERLGAAMKGMGVIGWVSMLSMAVPVVIELTRWIYKLIEGTARVDQVMQETLLTEEDFVAAQNEAVTSVKKEDRALTDLYTRLHKAKGKKEELHEIMVILKNKYPQYLKNINTEAESYRNVEAALKAVNEQLRIQALVKMRSSLTENAQSDKDSKEADVTKSVANNLESLFNRVGGKTNVPLNELKAKISEAIGEAAEKGLDIGMTKKKIQKIVNDNVKGADWNLSASANLQNLAAAAIKLQDIQKASKKAEKDIEEQVNTYSSMFGVDIKKVNEAVASSAQEAASGLNAVSRQIGEIEGQDPAVLKQWYDQLDRLGKMVKKQKDGSLSPEFVRLYKEAFGVDPKNMRDATDEIARMSEVIKQEMNGQMFNTDAAHQSPKHGSHKKSWTIGGVTMDESEIRKQSEAALAALEGYYLEKKRIEKQARLDDKITDQELENRIANLDKMYKVDLDQLYKKLLQQENVFVQEIYGKWFDGKNLGLLAKFIEQMGDAMTDGMKKNAEKAQNDALDIQVKHLEAIQKIIMQKDFVGKVDEQYQKQLEELELFWGRYQRINIDGAKEASEKQLKVFQKIAFNADFMTTKELRTALEKEGMTEWLKDRTEKDLEALLIVLQDYNDASIEAERKHANEQRRIVTKNWEWRAELQDKELKKQQLNEKMLEQLQSNGIIREGALIQLQLDHFAQRIAYQTRLVAELQRKGANYKEEQKALNALLESEHEKREEWLNSIRKRVMEYGDAIRELSESIASAGTGHSNLTSLAEIEAKKRLGIAIDTTKKEYLIYSQNGKAERVMLTEEEYLKKKMEIDSRNERLKATSDFLKKLGEKWSEEFTQQINSQMALARQREIEEQMTEFKNNAGEMRFQNAQSWMMQELTFATSWAAQMNDTINRAYTFSNTATLGGGTSTDATQTGSAPISVGGKGGGVGAIDTSVFKPIEAKDLMNIESINDGFKQMKDASKSASQSMSNDMKQASNAMTSSINLFGTAFAATMNENADAASVFGSLFIQYIGDALIKTLAASFVNTSGKMSFNMAEGITKVWGQLGIWGMLGVPLITAAFGSAMGLASRALTKSQSEISALTGASSGKKVAAGMLTYAEGNYPVLGSDGEVYDAKRETNWKTKVYSSPHYGILGEKGPELIVDGVTTRKMMTLRPDLYQDILDLAHGRQMVRARAYADGNYPTMPAGNVTDTQAMLVAAISQLNTVTSNLNAQLADGITIDALGERGAVKKLQTAETWMQKHGLM